MRVCELLLLTATELDEGETVEWRCGAELTKCEVVERRCDDDEEALVDARGVALVAVGTLGAALAFYPRRIVSSVSLSSGKVTQWEGAL
jgi:hypothetical protein